MYWEQQVQYASKTDVGMRRQNNEDSLSVRLATDEDEWQAHGHLFVVADGMGGHAVGELASKMCTDALPHMFFKLKDYSIPAALKYVIESINETIHNRGNQNRDFQRMGTTCTALALGPWGGYIGHVGDSRAYRIRRDRVDQLTFDHSLEWEMRAKGSKRSDVSDSFLKQYRNVITRSLGPENSVNVDIEGPHPVLPGDKFVLCSDGLSGMLTDEEIAGIAKILSPKEACRLLVHLANLRGGNDNCTVVIVEVGDAPAGYGPPPTVDFVPETPGLGWGIFLGSCALTALAVLGVAAVGLGEVLSGVTLLVLTALCLIPLTVAILRRQKANRLAMAEYGFSSEQTRINRSYMTAICRPAELLLADLATAGAELQHTAVEDDWPVDWEAHRTAVQAAQAAAERRSYARAVYEYGKVIHLLMTAAENRRTDPVTQDK